MAMPEKIIDAHMHFSNIQKFHKAAETSGVDYSYNGYLKECAVNNVVASVCMGLAETTIAAFPDNAAPSPMIADLDPKRPPGLNLCLGINPHSLREEFIPQIERMVTGDNGIIGFKIYAGYYHYHIHDKIYAPVYRLAAKYGLPVAIHTGDTYSDKGLLKYAHPLEADELALQWRDVNFILCHMGDPWIMDACEVAYKNKNVFVDISGLLACDATEIAAVQTRETVMQHYSQGITYLNNYKKVLYGTDWPLVPMKDYIEFCKKLMPESAYEDVFYNNAIRVYKLKV